MANAPPILPDADPIHRRRREILSQGRAADDEVTGTGHPVKADLEQTARREIGGMSLPKELQLAEAG